MTSVFRSPEEEQRKKRLLIHALIDGPAELAMNVDGNSFLNRVFTGQDTLTNEQFVYLMLKLSREDAVDLDFTDFKATNHLYCIAYRSWNFLLEKGSADLKTLLKEFNLSLPLRAPAEAGAAQPAVMDYVMDYLVNGSVSTRGAIGLVPGRTDKWQLTLDSEGLDQQYRQNVAHYYAVCVKLASHRSSANPDGVTFDHTDLIGYMHRKFSLPLIVGFCYANRMAADGYITTLQQGSTLIKVLHAPAGSAAPARPDRADSGIPSFLRRDNTPPATPAPAGSGTPGSVPTGSDPYATALALCVMHNSASEALLERHMGITAQQAAALLRRMEHNGVVTVPGQAGTRAVIAHSEKEMAAICAVAMELAAQRLTLTNTALQAALRARFGNLSYETVEAVLTMLEYRGVVGAAAGTGTRTVNPKAKWTTNAAPPPVTPPPVTPPAATPPAAAAAPQGGPPLSEQGLFDEINAYVGLESVKTEFKKLFNLARLSQERIKAGLPAERGALHLVFSGNPGTGKTSIARLVGKMYHQMGLLPTDRVVECSRKDLVAEYVGHTAKATKKKIEKAKGGVLFIDEVYTLSQPDSPTDFGHEAIAVLLEMMENGRDDLCVIIAGYSDEMRKFFEDNDGLKSRFPTIIEFPDYTAPELMEIITRLLDARKMVLDDAARARLLAVVTDIHSRRDRKFGNGREMRNLAEAIFKKQGVRLMTLSAAQRTVDELQRITEADIPDERVRTVTVNEQELFDEINAYVGLDSVKAEFRNLLNLARISQERLSKGLPADRGALHLVFSGNPGTGKTSIARLVGKMYHQLGLLRSDRVVECSRKDLVAQYVGQTAKATQEKIEEAKGGVLFIDEVYTLSRPDDPKDFGHEAIAVLLEMMENGRDDLCVIIAGYSDKMRQFFENNDGLKSRFPTEIEFPDYTAPELMEIVTRVLDAKKMVLDDAARARLLAVVTDIHSRRDEKFGNGREMRNLAEAICKQQGARLMTIPAAQRTATELQCITEGDIPDERVKGAKDVESVMEHLDGLIGLEKVKKEIRGLINIVKLNRRKIAQGRKPLPVSLHMVFEGNPGTGKTTVARLMGEIFRALGVLAKGQLVSANRSSLVTGRPANATKEVVRSALDGVLFIDEAYTLVKWGENDIGVEAINQLLEDMETYRDRLAVIVAGYTEPMKAFLAANPGMKSRFTRTITFDDYTPEQLLMIFEQRCTGHEMTLTPEAREVLLALLERIHANRKEDFGNARDMRTLFETTMGRLAARVNADASGTVSDSEILAVDIPEG